MIVFFIEGEPVGKGRPRFTRDGHVFTPAKTRTYERHIQVVCKGAMKGKPPSALPQLVSIEVEVKPPKSWSKAKKLDALTGKIAPGKPDLDNVAKAVIDGCNGVAYLDDAQVVGIFATKRYDEEEGVRVQIEEKSHG